MKESTHLVDQLVEGFINFNLFILAGAVFIGVPAFAAVKIFTYLGGSFLGVFAGLWIFLLMLICLIYLAEETFR